MPKYQVPFTEVINGYYIIEADSADHALELLDDGANFDEFDEVVENGRIGYDERLLTEYKEID